MNYVLILKPVYEIKYFLKFMRSWTALYLSKSMGIKRLSSKYMLLKYFNTNKKYSLLNIKLL